MNKLARSFRDLQVYQDSFKFQQEIFEISRSWPPEERYSLTGQIRRSSRSIGANLAEAWAKRRYPAHFLNKLTDSDGELQESGHWLNTARACGYITEIIHRDLIAKAESIGKQLGSMINQHDSFCSPH